MCFLRYQLNKYLEIQANAIHVNVQIVKKVVKVNVMKVVNVHVMVVDQDVVNVDHPNVINVM